MSDSPICLNATVSLARGNGGLDVDLSSMQSSSRNWLRIDELRVFIDPQNAILNPTGIGRMEFFLDLGFMVDVAISVGNEDLTTGFIGTPSHPAGERIAYIPAFLLGPRIYRRFATILNYNNVNGDGLPLANKSAYAWTLPRPMYVPPNTPIKFKVRRTGTVNDLDTAALYTDPFIVEVAAVGMRLDRRPIGGTRTLPHMHGWSPRNTNAERVESSEAFRNLHRETLCLTRLLGATATRFVENGAGGSSIDGTIQVGAAAIMDPTQIQLYDANNQDVLVPVPSATPLSPGGPAPQSPITSLLLAKTNSVRLTDRLLPNQTYRAIVSPVISLPDFRANQTLLMPMIGIESYREVR